MLILVSGFRGCGKSYFGSLAKKTGFLVFEMSEPVLKLMKKLKIKLTNKNIRNFATDLRKKKGLESVARLLIPKVKQGIKEKKTIVIIGLRSIEEVNVFKKLDNIITIGIICDEKKRFEYIKQRKKKGNPKTFSAFRWADEMEKKWGLKKLLKKCKIIIRNNSSKKEFTSKIRKILERYRG